jgi:hypothetical protein
MEGVEKSFTFSHALSRDASLPGAENPWEKKGNRNSILHNNLLIRFRRVRLTETTALFGK